MRGSTNKSSIKLSAAENKLTRWFVYEWEKPTRQKPHQVILRLPLPKFHYYHNNQLQVKESQYLIPTYSWTLTLIPNWTCSVVTISPFDARLLSTWLTNARIPVHDFNHQLEKVVGCIVLQFIPTMKIKKMLGHETLRCTYIATSSQEWWTRAKLCLRLQITWTNFAQHLCNLYILWWPLK